MRSDGINRFGNLHGLFNGTASGVSRVSLSLTRRETRRTIRGWHFPEWASGAAGSAREWHSRGHRFDPGLVHNPFFPDKTFQIAQALTRRHRASPMSVSSTNDQCRRLTQGFWGDLKLAVRRLLATPLFTIFAVLSLAVGVAVTTAVYSVVDSILLKDPGITDSDRIAFVVTPYEGRLLRGSVSERDFESQRVARRRELRHSGPGDHRFRRASAATARDGSNWRCFGPPTLSRLF